MQIRHTTQPRRVQIRPIVPSRHGVDTDRLSRFCTLGSQICAEPTGLDDRQTAPRQFMHRSSMHALKRRGESR